MPILVTPYLHAFPFFKKMEMKKLQIIRVLSFIKYLFILFCLVGSSGCHGNLEDNGGLILHFDFKDHDNNNSLVKDLSGNENNGVINGNPKWVENSLRSAFEFDGNNFIDCGNKKELNLEDSFTIETFVKAYNIPSSESDAGIIMKGKYIYGITRDERKDSNGIWIYINDNISLRSVDFITGYWQHIIFSYDKNLPDKNVKFYINGSLKGTKDYHESLDISTDNLYVGKGRNQYFHGFIDDIKIYNRALSEEEITHIFKNKFSFFTWTRLIIQKYGFFIIGCLVLSAFITLILGLLKRFKLISFRSFRNIDITASDEISYLKISNGISVARIFAIFWIFLVNYFSTSLFRSYYDVEYQYAIEKTENFLKIMNSNNNPWLIDKIMFVLSNAGWSGVVIFIFLVGFSLWLSFLKSKRFKISDYLAGRFNNVYIPYLISIIIASITGIYIRHIMPVNHDLLALILGAAKFHETALRYNPPIWFISMLFLLYLFFITIPLIYNKSRFVGLLSFTLILCGLWAFMDWSEPGYLGLGIAFTILLFHFIVMGLGVLISHIVYKYSKFKILKINTLNLITIFVIPVGFYLMFKFIYLDLSKDLTVPWLIARPYATGIIISFIFISIGYLLPIGFYKPLRWLSRGTFAVFLYHYVIGFFIIPYLRPEFFRHHLSLALILPFLVILILMSVFQKFIDKTIVRYAQKVFFKEYKI